MVKIGDKVIVKVEVKKIVEDKDGIYYVVHSINDSYEHMCVKERDFISVMLR